MPTVLLVRHATTPTTGKRLYGRKPGIELSEAGVAEAERTAAHLAATGLAAVYASPLERTQQTARIVARPHGLRVRTRDGLNEVDYGEWTDRRLADLRRLKAWRTVQQAPSRFTFPGGESMRGAQARFVDAVEAIAAGHGPRDVVAVVTHADLIRMAIAHFSGLHLDNFQRLVVAPASVTTIHLRDGEPPLVVATNTVPPTAAPPDHS